MYLTFDDGPLLGSNNIIKVLQEEGVDYLIGKNFHKDSAYGGDVLRLENGFVKLLFDASSHHLLGAHIVGPEAATMIHMCIAYINHLILQFPTKIFTTKRDKF
jgi:mycothione reductase